MDRLNGMRPSFPVVTRDERLEAVFDAQGSTRILNLEKRHAFVWRVVGLMKREHQASVERVEDHAVPAILAKKKLVLRPWSGEPAARRLGVNYMATEYDRDVGAFVDNLMFAREKAAYIFDHGFPEIENFYSDSLADTPMALCAEKAHLVTHKAQVVEDWPKLDVETVKKVHEKIDTGWSVHL